MRKCLAKNSNDNGDGSRYLFASDAKNYTWSGEETLRGRGGKPRQRGRIAMVS